MRSLQRRVILGGIAYAAISTIVGGLAISTVFDQIADRRFNDTLSERHTQLIVALGDSQSPSEVTNVLTDPAYLRVYSGRYWQVTNGSGTTYASSSLFDAELPRGLMLFDGAEIWEGEGPNGPIRGIRERVTLGDGSVWSVSVAESLTALAQERSEMQRSVLIAFAFIGLLGIGGAALLTSVLVSPLRKLGDDVRHRWDSESMLVPDHYPSEVVPLVEDINELMVRNRDILDRGRRQAADLAHALKTPSAAMRNQIVEFSRKVGGTEELQEALDRIDAQITRSLARMRASNAENTLHARTDVDHAVQRIERLFRSLPRAEQVSFDVSSMSSMVAIDPQDLEEMLGNVLENAFKWCCDSVWLHVEGSAQTVEITVEDDGPGINESHRRTVLEEGARLDTSVPGTGLGLSIVSDLAKAYGGVLDLRDSDCLGGLSCIIRLPVAARRTSAFSALVT